MEIDIQTNSPADYTLFIESLPKDYTKEELKEYIISNFCKDGERIVTIVSAYDITEYSK